MEKVIGVKGMMCPHCEARVKKVLEEISGIAIAVPSHKDSKVTLTLSSDVSEEIIRKAIEDGIYRSLKILSNKNADEG